MCGKCKVNWPGEQIFDDSAALKAEPLLLAAKVHPAHAAGSRQDPTLVIFLLTNGTFPAPILGLPMYRKKPLPLFYSW